MARLLLLILAVSLLSTVSALKEESYVRIQHEPDGSKIVIMFDFERVAAFYFNRADRMYDCTEYRRSEPTLGSVYYENSLMNGGDNVEYHAMDIDVAWYLRQCSRFHANMKRNGAGDDVLIGNFLERQRIFRGVADTKFCTLKHATYNSRLEWNNTETDSCCQQLHQCEHSLMPMDYGFKLFNAWPYVMYDCECMDALKKCLTNVGDDESRLVSRLVFEAVNPKCFRVQEVRSCNEWQLPWFDKCDEPTYNLKYVQV